MKNISLYLECTHKFGLTIVSLWFVVKKGLQLALPWCLVTALVTACLIFTFWWKCRGFFLVVEYRYAIQSLRICWFDVMHAFFCFMGPIPLLWNRFYNMNRTKKDVNNLISLFSIYYVYNMWYHVIINHVRWCSVQYEIY